MDIQPDPARASRLGKVQHLLLKIGCTVFLTKFPVFYKEGSDLHVSNGCSTIFLRG